MTRKFFRYHNGNGLWHAGFTDQLWDAYVLRFFAAFPRGELVWTHDEAENKTLTEGSNHG